MGKNTVKGILLLLLVTALPEIASAQFYVIGNDPFTRWRHNETAHYDVIFPSCCDSLAQVYCRNLESAYHKVGVTTQVLPNQYWIFGKHRKLPVILHPFTSNANGSVGISPSRMDLLTMSSPYDCYPIPWARHLAIHESRHVSQNQAGMFGWPRAFNYIFGEGGAAIPVGLYLQMPYLEGDAVIQETAWTNSGRGRVAEFLNYYRIAIDQGENRGFWQWYFGSSKYYAPNHYAFGYLNLASWRAMYDDPYLMSKMIRAHKKNPFFINTANHTLKTMTGRKASQLWTDVVDYHADRIKDEIEARAQFMEGRTIIQTDKKDYTTYTGGVVVKGREGKEYVYTIRYKFSRPWQLVRIDPQTGEEHRIRQFSYESSGLDYDPVCNRIMWSEKVTASSRSLKDYSRIYYYEPQDAAEKPRSGRAARHSPGHVKCLTPGKVYYFNPAPDGGKVVAVEYTPRGESFVVVINYRGEIEQRIPSPEGLQATEAVIDVQKGCFYVLGVENGGYALYCGSGKNDGEWSEILPAQPVVINNLTVDGHVLYFESDRCGVNEFYSFDGQVLTQLTSSRYGGGDYCFSDDSHTMYYAEKALSGSVFKSVALDSLPSRVVALDDVHKYFLAEKVTAQELRAASRHSERSEESQILRAEATQDDGVRHSERSEESNPRWSPQKYHKLPRLFKIHTWLPFYLNQGFVESAVGSGNLALDNVVTLGATVFFQNDLGTSTGSMAYSAHKDPVFNDKWRHAAKIHWSYTGILPVFSVDFSYNDRSAITYNRFNGTLIGTHQKDRPYILATVEVSLPFSFHSKGWLRALKASVRYSVTNNYVNLNPVGQLNGIFSGEVPSQPVDYMPLQTLYAYVSGYVRQAVPHAALMPRFGFGFQAGFLANPGVGNLFSEVGFVYGDFYLPFVANQGFRLSALVQIPLGNKPYIAHSLSSLPRGVQSVGGATLLFNNDVTISATFDWAIPINIRGWSLGDLFYIYRLKLNPFFDYSQFGTRTNLNLFSTGTDVSICFKKFLLDMNLTLGVRYAYNFGTGFSSPQLSLPAKAHHRVAPLVSIEF